MKKIVSIILSVAIILGVFSCYGVYSSAVSNILGDANSDGAINSFDALIIIRYATGAEKLSPAEVEAGDVDGNGLVNSTDALYVLHFSVGKISTFPAGNPREDGKRTLIYGTFWYDPATGAVTNLDGSGLLGFSYDAKDNAFYASLNAWQRSFGYTYIYDYAAPFGVIWYDTSRVFFDYDRIEYYDEENSECEDRYDLIGDTSAGNLIVGRAGIIDLVIDDILFVVYTERILRDVNGAKIEVTRLISARQATNFERGLYYGKYI